MTDQDQELLRALGAYARQHDQPAERDAGATNAGQRDAIAARLVQVLGSQPSPAASLRAMPLRRIASAAAWTVPLCAAAGVLLWLARPTEIEPLAEYRLEVAASAANTRGVADPGRLKLRSGALTRLVVRPATRVQQPVQARVFLTQGATLTPVAAQVTADPAGALQVQFALPPGTQPGAAEVIVLVGLNDLLATRAPELLRTAAERGLGYQRWSLPADIEPLSE